MDDSLRALEREVDQGGGPAERFKYGSALAMAGRHIDAAQIYNSLVSADPEPEGALAAAHGLLAIGYKADAIRHLNPIGQGSNPREFYLPAKQLLVEALFGESIDTIRRYNPGDLEFQKIQYLKSGRQLADLAKFSDPIDLQRAIFEVAVAEQVLQHYLQETGETSTTTIIKGVHPEVVETCKEFYKYWQALRPKLNSNTANTFADYSIPRNSQPDAWSPKISKTDIVVELTNNPESIGYNRKTRKWEAEGGTKTNRALPITGYPIWTSMEPLEEEAVRLQEEDPEMLARLRQDVRLYTSGIPHKTVEDREEAVQSSIQIGIPGPIAEKFTSQFSRHDPGYTGQVVLFCGSFRSGGPFYVGAYELDYRYYVLGALRASKKG